MTRSDLRACNAVCSSRTTTTTSYPQVRPHCVRFFACWIRRGDLDCVVCVCVHWQVVPTLLSSNGAMSSPTRSTFRQASPQTKKTKLSNPKSRTETSVFRQNLPDARKDDGSFEFGSVPTQHERSAALHHRQSAGESNTDPVVSSVISAWVSGTGSSERFWKTCFAAWSSSTRRRSPWRWAPNSTSTRVAASLKACDGES